MSISITNIFNKIKSAKLSDEEIYWSLIAKDELTTDEENQLAALLTSLGIDEKHMDEDMKMIEKIRGLRDHHAHSQRLAAGTAHHFAEFQTALQNLDTAQKAFEVAQGNCELAKLRASGVEEAQRKLDNWEGEKPFAAKYA